MTGTYRSEQGNGMNIKSKFRLPRDLNGRHTRHMPDLGGRGIGEIGIVGVPAAVANAIFHATGKTRVRSPDHPCKLI
jgi:hypothetical protein